MGRMQPLKQGSHSPNDTKLPLQATFQSADRDVKKLGLHRYMFSIREDATASAPPRSCQST